MNRIKSLFAAGIAALALLAFPIATTSVAVFSTGCAAVAPGADPLVVNAERGTAIALDTFDTFLLLEYQNRTALESLSPGIHEFAEQIRTDAPQWIATARALTRAYKLNRTPENKAALATAVAVLETALKEAQAYIAEAAASQITVR